MSVEDIKAEVESTYPKKYVDIYTMEDDPIDPLAKVVPTTEGQFFGTYALNIIVFTTVYTNGDDKFDDQYDESKARLMATFDKFAKYELHIFIDSNAGDIKGADDDKLDAFKERLTELGEDLGEYGVTYHGEVDDLATPINGIVEEFIKGT